MICPFLTPFFVGFLTLKAITPVQDSPPENALTTPNILLAEEFTRVARMAAQSKPLTTTSIEAALSLATQSTLLTPDNPKSWSVLFELAQMADREDIARKAMEKILHTSNQSVTAQLGRLRDVINKAQTLDQRMLIFEQLLSEGKRTELDSRVASRLAFDAANLQRQAGNMDQFARWLAESVALDPAFPDAITLATGYFGDDTADIFQRAELLATAALSNIRDLTTQVVLAEFLMAFGDYKDARSLYEIILAENAGDVAACSDSLLADIVLSQFAVGDITGALNALQKRQTAVDEVFRSQTKQQQPRLTPLELARIHAPLVPKLATVRAALYSIGDDKVQAASALDAAVGSLLTLSKIYEAQGAKATLRVVELYIQAASITLWLSDDYETAELLLQSAETAAEIDPEEKKRFEGWIALRKGETDNAIAVLSKLQNDPASKVGLALAYLEVGNKRNAAIELLDVVKNNGGSLLGVWSKYKLEEIVGTTFDVRPEVAQLQELMSGVLRTMDLFVKDPRPPIGIKITPRKRTYNPFEPILIDIEIQNNTTIPLTIAHNGPIQPLLLVEPIIEGPLASISSNQPIVVPIDSELSLFPRSSLAISMDLRSYWLGGVLNTNPTKGASLLLKATVNFFARKTQDRDGRNQTVFGPTRFGQKVMDESIRINGVRLNDTWLKKAIEQVENFSTTQDIVSMVLLTWVVGEDIQFTIEEPLITPRPGEEVPPLDEGERHPNQDKAITTVLKAFPSLDPVAQAWVVATMSKDPAIESVVGMMKMPKSTFAQLAWIIRFADINVVDEALDDPALLEGLTSEDPAVQVVAKWVYALVEQIVQLRKEQQLAS